MATDAESAGSTQELAERAQELAERVRELTALLDNSPDILARYDHALRLRFANATAERAFGHPRAALLGRPLGELPLPPEVREAWTWGLRQVFATSEPSEGEFAWEGPDGRRHFHARLTPERDASGAVVSVLVTARDVTEQRRAEEALRRRERVLRDGEHLAGFGSWAWEVGTERVTWSDEIFRMFGLAPAPGTMTQSDFYARVHPDDRARVVALVEGTVARRGTYDVHFRIVRADGTVRLLRERAFVETDAHGAPVRLVGVTQDVTEREAAERALREREERFRALVEHASDLIVVLDPDGTKRYASPSYETVLGYTPGEMIGRNAFEFVHPDDEAAFRAALRHAAARPGPSRPPPLRFRHRDGSWRTLLGVLTDLRHAPGVGGIVANARDVTEQLQLEERLRQSQKLEALGQLAGGVAHDFNNILAAILGYGQMLRDALAPGDPRREDAEEVVRAAARGTDLTRQLLAFGRRQAVETEVLDLAAVARDTARMLRPLLPPAITLEAPPDDAPPVPARAARAHVAQIVLNLALNARDAMPAGGTLTIAARTARPPGEPPSAELVVRDTGVGIAPEVRAHLFEPFFTTKSPGLGTGLGLATVYGLTRQFDGTVSVDSEPGRGSTFTVSFPLAAEPLDAVRRTPLSAPTVSGAPGGRRGRVLVVDDEAPIRAIARRALEGAGYEAVLEADAARALERLRAGEPFDLVLTDAAMPGMSGWRLAAEVAASRASLPVVLMSGYAEPSDAGGAGADRDGSAAGVTEFLEKPFATRQLVEVVGRALARSRATG